jgi:hypothetical protein
MMSPKTRRKEYFFEFASFFFQIRFQIPSLLLICRHAELHTGAPLPSPSAEPNKTGFGTSFATLYR